jgi:hypothetical protein
VNSRRPLLLLGIAALLPLVALSLGLGMAALLQQQAGLEQTARERTARIAALVERELDAQIGVLRTIAQSPVLDGSPEPRAVADLLARARQGRPLWLAASLSDREGSGSSMCPSPSAARLGASSSVHRATPAW